MNSYTKLIKFTLAIYPLLAEGKKLAAKDRKNKSIAFRKLLEQLGPTYIKLGQILALRYDLLHKDTCSELQILLDSQEKAFSPKQVKKILHEELGITFEKYLEIEYEPLAVASLGQVHIGHIKSKKKKVAVKLLKPGTRSAITNDIKVMLRIIQFLNIIPPIRRLNLQDIIAEFGEWTLKELDYSLEAANTEKFTLLFKDDKSVVVPKVYREFSTDNILVTEFIEGVSAKELINAQQEDSTSKIVKVKDVAIDKEKLVKTIENLVHKQVFIFGYFHGDPHPSNIILTKDGKVAYVDFGIMAQINKTQLEIFKQTVFDLAAGKTKEVVKSFLLLDTIPGSKSEAEILQHMEPLIEKANSSLAEEYSPTQFLLDTVYEAAQLGIQAPRFLVLLAKVLAAYDGLLQIVNPEANLLAEIAETSELDKVNPLSDESIKTNLQKGYATATDLVQLLLSLPKETHDLLHDLRVNGIKINTNTGNSTPPIKSNRGLQSVMILGTVAVIFLVKFPANTAHDWLLLLVWCIICILIYLINYHD